MQTRQSPAVGPITGAQLETPPTPKSLAPAKNATPPRAMPWHFIYPPRARECPPPCTLRCSPPTRPTCPALAPRPTSRCPPPAPRCVLEGRSAAAAQTLPPAPISPPSLLLHQAFLVCMDGACWRAVPRPRRANLTAPKLLQQLLLLFDKTNLTNLTNFSALCSPHQPRRGAGSQGRRRPRHP